MGLNRRKSVGSREWFGLGVGAAGVLGREGAWAWERGGMTLWGVGAWRLGCLGRGGVGV